MTKEQFTKAEELNAKIKIYKNKIDAIINNRRIKKYKDTEAKHLLENRRSSNNFHEEWTISKFFTLIFDKRQVKVLAHYEFAEAIELDADEELIDLILDYLRTKKEVLEKEFEQIGGETNDR